MGIKNYILFDSSMKSPDGYTLREIIWIVSCGMSMAILMFPYVYSALLL